MSPFRKRHPLYRAWSEIKYRCTYPGHAHYADYGGRGIRLHEPWFTDFATFAAYVGPRPSRRHSLDRINNDGNYEPGNLRWATQREQMRNTRSNRLITINGETAPFVVWAERLGVNYKRAHARFMRGVPAEEALR